MSAAEPSHYLQFLGWIVENHVGDLAGIAGVIISIVGFTVTVVGVMRSRTAAERAESASRETRDSIRLLEAVVDFAAAISILEEIKRLHRKAEWSLLPDRYAHIRKLLITLKATNIDLNDSQKTIIQSALANLYSIEAAVERALANPAQLKAARFNALITTDVDNLLTVLNELKAKKIGA
jgi:hypothetical protein